LTKYPLICNCGNQYDLDIPPPDNAKPREKPEDLEPAGVLSTTAIDGAVCPKCSEKGRSKYDSERIG